MNEPFAELLAIGGKSNSLGKAGQVVEIVLKDKSRLAELYNCLFEADEWLRMRAADSLEKVCRVHPEWLKPYTDRIIEEMGTSNQASLQWHVAQMLGELHLSPQQQRAAVHWLKDRLQEKNIDWIVAANAMSTLVQFSKAGLISTLEVSALLTMQLSHSSQSVRKRATKLLAELQN